jgi:uncharacterized membrane protein HdeD (DUF308 family)
MKKPTIDQGAALLGAVLTILGVLDVAAMLAISADDLAMLVGAIATLAGYVRHRFGARTSDPTSGVDVPTSGADAPTTGIGPRGYARD